MKKLVSLLVSAALVMGLAAGTGIFASAEEIDLTPDFTDNFDSYSTGGFIEDDPAIRKNWENELMLNIDGDATAAADAECKGVAKIIEDPTGGAAGNKVLHIKNYDPIGSFFYMAPKGLRVQNFELSFKMYSVRSDKEPWIGISARKDSNVRYNGCNNMLMNMKMVKDASKDPAREVMPLSIFRGYAGAGNPQDKTSQLDTYGSKEDPGNTVSNYNGDEYQAGKNLLNTWITVKYTVVKEGAKTKYSGYVITGDGTETRLGTLEYSSKSVDGYGFVSLNACICDIYVDDFQVKNLDEEPAPVLKDAPQVSIAVSDVKETEASFAVTVVDPDNSMDGLGLDYIEFINVDDENDLVRVNDVNATKVTGLKTGTKYKAVVTYSYDIEDGNVIKQGAATSDQFETTGGKTDPEPEKPDQKGCGSTVTAAAIGTAGTALVLTLAAVLCIRKKYRKED